MILKDTSVAFKAVGSALKVETASRFAKVGGHVARSHPDVDSAARMPIK